MKNFSRLIYLLSYFFLLSLILLTARTTHSQEADSHAGQHSYEDYRVIPPEPGDYDEVEVDNFIDTVTGLFFRLFDLNESGRINYMTARRTNSSYMNEFWNTVVYRFQYPIFYWIDINGNGKFEPALGEMWIDSDEDGLNGNERLYGP